MQTATAIAALVPRRLWSNDYGAGVRPCRGVILFADIAGFTRLTETARRRAGTRGIELLTSHVNAIFSDLVDAAHQSGGDVLKFGGDAILVAYDATDSEQLSVSAAINGACAMELAMARHRRTTLRALSLHLGLAQGGWNEIVAGIPGKRREHFVWGDAITRAMHAADSGGKLPRIDCTRLLLATATDATQFERVGRNLYEFKAKRSKPFNELSIPNAFPINADALWDFLAEGLRDVSKISSFHPERSAEHRNVSTLFGFWRCPGIVDHPSQSAILFDRVFHATHRTEQTHSGLWARSDPSGDKQKLLILFGATHSSPDDTDRALAAAQALQGEFAEIKREFPSLRLGIGVATATVLAGFVGHRMRREFTAMGDGVNLAARLAAKSQRHAVLVDSRSRSESVRFQFRSVGTLNLKNVRKPTSVFVPGAEIDATASAIRGDIIDHPVAMAESLRRWENGATCICLSVSPGVNHRRFVAQLVSKLEIPERERHHVSFDSSDGVHPLGGVRRICSVLLSASVDGKPQVYSGSLADMLHESGHWASRSLTRLGPDAAALAVAREILLCSLPNVLVILDHFEIVSEFDRRVISELMTHRGPRWLAIRHSDPSVSFAAGIDTPIQLGALPRTEFAQVIGDLLSPVRPSRSLLEFLFDRSQGVPQMARSLASHLIAQGAATRTNGRYPTWHLRTTENLDLPSGLRAQYLQHVDRLPLREQQLLRAICVLGDSSSVSAVRHLCPEYPDAEVNDSVARLQSHGLITQHVQGHESRVAVDDPTCRQAVYETMSHQLRESWHREAAVYSRSTKRPDPAQVGEHLFRARDSRSVRWLTRAARNARRFWSLDRALRFTRWSILAMQGRCDPEYMPTCPAITGELSGAQEALYNSLADILRLQGRHAESGRVQHWLALHAARRGDRRLACQHRLATGRMELLAGRYRHSQLQAANVLKLSRQLHDMRLCAQASYLLGETYRRSGRVDRSLRALQEAESLARRGSDRLLHADVLNGLGLLHWNCGRLDEAHLCFEQSLRRLPRQTDHARRGQVANNLGILTEEQGRLRSAEKYYRKAFNVFDKTGVRRNRAYSLGNLANLYRHAARYERAREAYEEVETELLAMGETHAAAYTVGNIGDLERDFGDIASARTRYEATLEFARKAGDEELKAECYARIARLHLLSSRLDLMPRLLNLAQQSAKRAESSEFSIYSQLLRAELDFLKGRMVSARQRVEAAQIEVKQIRLMYYQLWTDHLLVRLDLHGGDSMAATMRCRAGMAKARSSGYAWWELRFATCGSAQAIKPSLRRVCRSRCIDLVQEMESGMGATTVRDQFRKLPLVGAALAHDTADMLHDSSRSS